MKRRIFLKGSLATTTLMVAASAGMLTPVICARKPSMSPKKVRWRSWFSLSGPREARAFEAKGYLVMASQMVIDMLLDEESTGLADLQDFIGKPIHLQVEPTHNQESYDVVLM